MTVQKTSTSTSTEPAAAPQAVVFPWILVVPTVLAVLASSMDPLLTKNTFDLVLNDNTRILGRIPISWLIALGIFLGSIIPPVEAGYAHAMGRSEAWAMPTWGLIGAGVFLLRLFEPLLVGHDFQAYTDQAQWVAALPIAILMGGVYLATGLGFKSIAQQYMSSPWHIVRPALHRAQKSTAKAIEAEGVARHALAALDTNENQLTLLAHEFEIHRIRLRNTEAELKDRVRASLAAHLGDPSETGLMHEPHKSSHATEQSTTN